MCYVAASFFIRELKAAKRERSKKQIVSRHLDQPTSSTPHSPEQNYEINEVSYLISLSTSLETL